MLNLDIGWNDLLFWFLTNRLGGQGDPVYAEWLHFITWILKALTIVRGLKISVVRGLKISVVIIIYSM